MDMLTAPPLFKYKEIYQDMDPHEKDEHSSVDVKAALSKISKKLWVKVFLIKRQFLAPTFTICSQYQLAMHFQCNAKLSLPNMVRYGLRSSLMVYRYAQLSTTWDPSLCAPLSNSLSTKTSCYRKQTAYRITTTSKGLKK